MELTTLRAFEAEIKKHLPTFKLAFKDESSWMKVLAFFAAPFNPKFMTSFITTIAKTVYFPSRASYESTPKSSFTVLAHEFVHMSDSEKYPAWFSISYMLPQLLSPVVVAAYAALVHKGWIPALILALGVVLGCWAAKKSVAFFFLVMGPMFVASAVLAILLTHWWAALFFGGLGLLAPLPSPWRTHWEMRGYAMSLAVMQWTYGPPPQIIRDLTAKHFYGPDYFFMSWSKSKTSAGLDAAILQAQNGDLQKDPPYGIVYDFLATQKQLRGS